MGINRWRQAMLLSLLMAASAHAAKPVSVTFLEDNTSADGGGYTQYRVKCSNGKKHLLTAWDNRTRWCVGELNTGQCKTKQIEAARAACSADQPEGKTTGR